MTVIDKESKQTIEQRLLAEHAAVVGVALNGSNAAIHEKRRIAIRQFETLGLPSVKDEAWKYTNIRRSFDRDLVVATGKSDSSVGSEFVAQFEIPGLDAYRIVLVDGSYEPELSRIGNLPDGIRLTDLRTAISNGADLVNKYFGRHSHADTEVFEALNTAFVNDGVFGHVSRGVAIDKPIHVINIASARTAALIQPRILIALEANASATIIESSVTQGDGDVFINSVVELYAARDARVEYYRLQLENDNATTVTSTNVYQEASSYAKTTSITVGGQIVRNNLRFLPDAEHCESHLTGLVLASGRMHVDNHTSVDHAKPNCVSNELYKNILDDKSTGIFNGRVLVRQDAQKTRAYQSNKSVVLGDDARMYSKPELEIYADDVLCSHGAATGKLDAESIFYLRSRGIAETTARRMMLQAFSSDVIDGIGITSLREYVHGLIQARL